MQTRPAQPEMLRTFVAVELPDEVRAHLQALQDSLRDRMGRAAGAVRWTRPEGIHLTLLFLGDTPSGAVGQIGQALKAACVGRKNIRLHIGELGAFPNTRRPRVLWVGLEGGAEAIQALYALQKSVASSLGPLGFKDDVKFKPHLTLGRVRETVRRDEIEAISSALALPIDDAPPSFHAQHVSLMRSQLQPGGSIYTEIVAVELGAQDSGS